MDSPETELAKSASFSSHLTCVNSQHNPFPVFAACTALSAVSGILSVTTRLCRFFATGTCSYDGTAAFFPVPKESLMPQQHPDDYRYWSSTRTANASCFQRKHRQIPMSLPDASARRITALWWYYATTDFCSAWNVHPVATAAGARVAAPAISTCRTGCRKKTTKNKRPSSKQGGDHVVFI